MKFSILSYTKNIAVFGSYTNFRISKFFSERVDMEDQKRRKLVLALAAAGLSACGGGGSSSPSQNSNTTSNGSNNNTSTPTFATGASKPDFAAFASSPLAATGVFSLTAGSGASVLPTSIDLRATKLLPPVGDQGQQPSCTAWAIGYGLGSYVRAAQRNILPTDSNSIASPADLYAKLMQYYKRNLCNSGTEMHAALGLMVSRGIDTLSGVPYSEGACSRVSSQSIFNVPGFKLIGQVANFGGNPNGWNITEIKKQLAMRLPVGIVVNLAPDFGQWGFGASKTGVFVSSVAWNDENRWHSMLVVGYDDNSQSLLVLNSWGKDFGDKGYFRIAYQEFLKWPGQAWGVEGVVVPQNVSTDLPPLPVVEPPRFEDTPFARQCWLANDTLHSGTIGGVLSYTRAGLNSAIDVGYSLSEPIEAVKFQLVRAYTSSALGVTTVQETVLAETLNGMLPFVTKDGSIKMIATDPFAFMTPGADIRLKITGIRVKNGTSVSVACPFILMDFTLTGRPTSNVAIGQTTFYISDSYSKANTAGGEWVLSAGFKFDDGKSRYIKSICLKNLSAPLATSTNFLALSKPVFANRLPTATWTSAGFGTGRYVIQLLVSEGFNGPDIPITSSEFTISRI